MSVIHMTINHLHKAKTLGFISNLLYQYKFKTTYDVRTTFSDCNCSHIKITNYSLLDTEYNLLR